MGITSNSGRLGDRTNSVAGVLAMSRSRIVALIDFLANTFMPMLQLLSAQEPKSREAGNEAHEEMLFITTHRECFVFISAYNYILLRYLKHC